MNKAALIFVLSIGIFFSSHISAFGAFGVSPADITYETLRPGMTISENFLLSRNELETTANVVVETDIPGADEWVSIEPGINFVIPAGERTREMTVTISVPQNAPYREYNGYIFVKIIDDTSPAAVAVVQGVGITVNLQTTDIAVDQLLVRRIEIPSFNQGNQLEVEVTTENQGNRLAAPDELQIYVEDLFGEEQFSGRFIEFEDVPPGDTREVAAAFDNDLLPGEYRALVNVLYQGEDLREDNIVFEVLPADKVQEQPEEDRQMDKSIWIYVLAIWLIILIIILLLFIRSRKSEKDARKSKKK